VLARVAVTRRRCPDRVQVVGSHGIRVTPPGTRSEAGIRVTGRAPRPGRHRRAGIRVTRIKKTKKKK
jgi:hypothetical protein